MNEKWIKKTSLTGICHNIFPACTSFLKITQILGWIYCANNTVMTIWKFSVVSLLFLFNLSFLKLCEIIRIRIILADLGIWWWYCVCRWAPATSSPALGAAWTAWWSWRCLWLSWHPVRWPAWRPGTLTSCKCYILDANVAYTLMNFSFLS